MLSASFLVLGGFLVQKTWSENYGDRSQVGGWLSIPQITHTHTLTWKPVDSEGLMTSSLVRGLNIIRTDWSILAVGVMVSLFEGSMYTFVFLWGPVLESSCTYEDKICMLIPCEASDLPYGWVFATFMVCIMIGSIVFRVALQKNFKVERMAPCTCG